VWSFSGSGCALYVAKPTWQTDKGCTRRTDNDVSAVASAGSPVSVYDTYSSEPGWQDVGGTSVGTPLLAGAIALETAAQRSEGAKGIYEHPASWFDVTEGRNWLTHECSTSYLCRGEVGYDGPSGIGAPDGGATATAPGAWTEPASSTTTAAATLNGVADAEAGASTKYYFQYGASSYYGHVTPTGGATVSGYTSPSRVSQAISGLKASTQYHYRLVVANGNGTTYGADQTFATAPKVYLSKLGAKGTGEGQFEEPQFTATNGEGDVWVSDYGNDRVEEFSPSGSFMKSCGKAGSGEVQFNGPTGIAVSPSGKLYVSDSGNGRIEVLEQNCAYWDSFGKGDLSSPMGLTFTSGPGSGLALVANSGANDIAEFSTTTEIIGEKYVQKYEGSYGSSGQGQGQFADPTDVAFAGRESSTAQAFYVVDSGNDRVQEFSIEGLGRGVLTYKFDEAFGAKGSGEGQLLNPTAATRDLSTGDIEVTDTGNDRIEQFLPNGAYVGTSGTLGALSGDLNTPKGIVATAAGKLYVADTLNNRVSVWGPSETSSPEWFVTATPNPPRTLDSYLEGVSCVKAATACSAVGEYTVESGGASEPIAEWWNGVEWKLQTTASPSRYSSLDGSACVTASWCVGVGLYKNSVGTYVSLAEGWTGGSWSIQLLPEPGGTLNSGLVAVSCSSTSACTAVGEYEAASGSLLPFAERWNGSEWKVQTMPEPAGAAEAFATGVACTGASACTMAGTYKSSVGVYAPYAETWNGSEWTLQSMPTPSGASSTRMEGGVACTSASACTTTGYYVNAAGVQVTLAERWNGIEWALQSTPNPAGAKSSSLRGVACITGKSCTAAGVSLNSVGKWVTLAEQWNGKEWNLLATPNGERGEGWLTGGVACIAAPAPCVAVGNTGQALAEVYG
jgi:hypothetical protein